MIYEYNGHYYLHDQEISRSEYEEIKRMYYHK